MGKYLKKDSKTCQNCLHLHTGRINICDYKGVIDLPFETICKEFKCFSCGKTDKLDKCECYDDIKVKYNLD